MTDRPTLDELAVMVRDRLDGGLTSEVTITEYRAALAAHGYRIVCVDDVPEASGWNGGPTIPPGFDMGWNACRAFVVGEGT